MANRKTKVDEKVIELVEKTIGSSPFKVGDVVDHPKGYKVKIVDGEYWGTYGISNFWHWHRVLEDGTLSEEKESGYGWRM